MHLTISQNRSTKLRFFYNQQALLWEIFLILSVKIWNSQRVIQKSPDLTKKTMAKMCGRAVWSWRSRASDPPGTTDYKQFSNMKICKVRFTKNMPLNRFFVELSTFWSPLQFLHLQRTTLYCNTLLARHDNTVNSNATTIFRYSWVITFKLFTALYTVVQCSSVIGVPMGTNIPCS